MLSVGFDVRVPGMSSDPDVPLRLVTEGEQMGYDYITFSDHLVSPLTVGTRYPYNVEGRLSELVAGPRHEMLAAIAYYAAKTSRLRFVTSVMVVPYRPPVLTAKILSTIDNLSGGRLTVGVGTGWMRDEFEAIGAPDFDERGKVTDEYLEAITMLWTAENPRFEGRYVNVSGISFAPKPAQKPHPPLWIGGLSRPALRRLARFGDVWYPVLTDQAKRLDSLSRLRRGIDEMRAVVAAAGRDPQEVSVAMRVHQHGETLPVTVEGGERRLFSGAGHEIARDLIAIQELGISSVDFRFSRGDVGEALTDMKTFQREVVAGI